MTRVKAESREHGMLDFNLYEDDVKLAEMVTRVNDGFLTVYHTEVFPGSQGRGLAKQLLKAMVSFARDKNLRVVPLCEFVRGQFDKFPEKYADIRAID